jgi:hypothetical protein
MALRHPHRAHTGDRREQHKQNYFVFHGFAPG